MKIGNPKRRQSKIGLAVLAAGLALVAAPPAGAQSSQDFRVAADGTIEFERFEVFGTLQNFVMLSFSRAPLGIRLLELRQSFIEGILESVRGAPF